MKSLWQHNSNTQHSFYQTLCCNFFYDTYKMYHTKSWHILWNLISTIKYSSCNTGYSSDVAVNILQPLILSSKYNEIASIFKPQLWRCTCITSLPVFYYSVHHVQINIKCRLTPITNKANPPNAHVSTVLSRMLSSMDAKDSQNTIWNAN